MIELDISKRLRAADGDMNLRIQFEVPRRSFVTLYGESGVGKTSTLRMLSGLLKPEKGKIIVNGKTWFDSDNKINLPPQQRQIGYVFQDYALFPNMTVRQNLEFALRKNQDQKIVSDLIQIVELIELQNRLPKTLSGGQKQRVALARALVQKPEILLLDEPLSALDRKIRLKLQDYLLEVHHEFNLTTILISHDIGEIIKLSNRVFILEKGQITQQGNPDEIFLNQKINNQFKFTGEILKIEKQKEGFLITVLIQSNLVKIKTPLAVGVDLKIGDKVLVASELKDSTIYKFE